MAENFIEIGEAPYEPNREKLSGENAKSDCYENLDEEIDFYFLESHGWGLGFRVYGLWQRRGLP